jgi:hypothetical protein
MLRAAGQARIPHKPQDAAYLEPPRWHADFFRGRIEHVSALKEVLGRFGEYGSCVRHLLYTVTRLPLGELKVRRYATKICYVGKGLSGLATVLLTEPAGLSAPDVIVKRLG